MPSEVKSTALCEAIVASAHHLMIATNCEGMVTFFNQASERALGYSSTEVVDKHSPALWHQVDEIVEHAQLLSEKLGRTIEPGFGVFTALAETDGSEASEWTLTRKNGTTFPACLTVTGINDAEGKTVGYLGVIEDITERKCLIQQLQQTNHELEEFTYRTSHDLRSPLVSAVQLLRIASNAIESKEESLAVESLAHAEDSLVKLEALVGDILRLVQSKHLEEVQTEIDVEEAVNGAIAKVEHMGRSVQIERDLQFSGKLIAKESRLNLIIENMISNAIKYQDVDEERSYVRVETRVEDSSFVLRVSDNGLGIPPRHHTQLFQMFKRFHTRTAFGSGLGLYMMRTSAHVLGGDVFFEAPDKGAVFGVRIPLVQSPSC